MMVIYCVNHVVQEQFLRFYKHTIIVYRPAYNRDTPFLSLSISFKKLWITCTG